MDSMFGLSMTTIMFALLGLMVATLAITLVIFIRNRLAFLMGLRNIPRRVAQSVLIVIGLMLSTVIITAAFTTGDTVDYSITKATYDLFGHADIILESSTNGVAPGEGEDTGANISGSEYRRFLETADAAQVDGVDGFMGVLWEPVPVLNPQTQLSEPDLLFTGIDVSRVDAFPDILDVGSGDELSISDLAPDEVYLNESAAAEMEAGAGSVLTVFVEGQPHEYTVAAVVEDRAATGALDVSSPEGMVTSLDNLQALFGNDEITLIAVSVEGNVRNTLDRIDSAEADLDALIADEGIALETTDTKLESVESAEEFGNFMTTFFLILGLFSIAAGILLVVMIFVMLAAERKSEMGMARAVGMKRRHLVEMFIAEGTGYNLMSAAAGVAIGIGVAFALVTAASSIFATFGFTFTPHVSLRTMVISYSLGIVLTFVTVAFSSWRVSTLNIVAAIRDTPEYSNKRMGWKGMTTWIIFMILSVLIFYAGLAGDAAFPVGLGFSVITMGVAVFMTHFGLPARPVYTVASIILLLFWGFAAGNRLDWLFGTLDGDIEMFFLSGISMVTASTFLIIYNSDILLAVISQVGGAFGPILPALRTAVAYPLANRFRTGMTLAMISLVVFALTTMSAMNLNYDKLFLQDESRGGWDVQVIENPNNRMASVRAALEAAGSPAADEIRTEGAVELSYRTTEAIQVGDDGEVPNEFDEYTIRGLTPGFVENGSVPIDKVANGYEDAGAVWNALLTEPDVAIIDGFIIQSGFGPNEFSVDGIDVESDTFDSPTIAVRNPHNGAIRELRVIGVIAFGASSNFQGIYMGSDAYRDVFGEPELSVHFVALENPDASREVANDIEAALVRTGTQAESLEELAAENNALSRSFLYLMQAFMGLGLVVGIAAIGVIAFRTVVERRQQIGMLRAIGYKKSMVSLSFLMESSFVTVLGVTSGTFLGLWLAYFLVTSDDFPGDGDNFYIPWLEVAVINTLTVIASLAMTIIPSRQAASVPTAEALRYE
ncbi:MAG TPA: FtsX-like permease family protein [Dehalococcoidia bacterium]|nr:FtsX-like permease family protein [Dehalococcoidia bacterium]